MTPDGLAALEARLAYELACLQLPASRWTPERMHEGSEVADVAIVGAGMAGLALAAALLHRGIAVVVYDQAPAGAEGPWATTARMETLRSPKQLAGPALGIPSLTFRAWFEAQFGSAAWDALDKIPRLQWMDYLRWYRAVLALPVHNGHRVTDLVPRDDGLVELAIDLDGRSERAWARRVVVATGRAGLGGPSVPAFAAELAPARWVHSSDDYDYALLAGLRVGVVGGGASAMDSAATALEEGAAQVHLLVRRPDLARINKGKGAGNPGFVQGYGSLPDDWKWRIRHYINEQQAPPPRNSTLRVSRHANAHFNLGVAIESVDERAGALQVQTSAGPLELDFLIFATGFTVDWRQRPMLRHIAPCIRLWKDRYRPPAGEEDSELAESPDLGAAFEFQARPGAHCPGLERVHCFCYPATLSLGVITGDIPAISEGALQLADRLAALLYGEDIELHFARIEAFAEPEILGDEWVAAPLPPSDSSRLTHKQQAMNDSDVIDRAAGLAPGDPLHAARRFRAKVVDATQASHDALLMQPVAGLSSADRLRVAAHACSVAGASELARHYADRLAAAGDEAAAPSPALPAMLQFAATLMSEPRRGDRAALAALKGAGLDDAAIVALAQLIAFLAYQVRVVAGLQALRASRENRDERPSTRTRRRRSGATASPTRRSSGARGSTRSTRRRRARCSSRCSTRATRRRAPRPTTSRSRTSR